jgi:23S rRNA pseudouridine2604 synthase
MNMQDDEAVWLNKFISESGICSRREADKLIEDGKVTINREIGQKGDQVFPGDKVRIDGRLIMARKEEEIIFIALNKPVGIVSTTEKVKDNIVKFVNHPERIFPIGRLDKDSEGLIFLTNNGDMVNKILRAGNNHEKEYMVTVDRPLTDKVIAGLANGVPMLGTVTKKCVVVKEGANSFRITLVQGLNRQIRRMCEYFEYEVVKLKRIRIMNITLKGIPLGEWRELDQDEMSQIYQLTAGSSSEKTQESKPRMTIKERFAPHENKQKPEKSKYKTEGFKSNEKPFVSKNSSFKKSNESDYDDNLESDSKRKSSESKFTKSPSAKTTKGGKSFLDRGATKSKPKPGAKTTKEGKPFLDRGATKSKPKSGVKTTKEGKPFLDRGATKSKPKPGVKTTKEGKPFLDRGATKSKPKSGAPKSGRPTSKPRTLSGRPGSGQRTKKGGY